MNRTQNNKIYLTRKKPQKNDQNVIKLTDQAMNALIEIVAETNMPLRQVASQIIIQAVEGDLIRFTDEGSDNGEGE